MSLIIETGMGVAGAVSFVTASDADAYFAARGITTWTGDTPAKECALIRAAQYLNSLTWRGYKVNYKQPLAWPRYEVPIGDLGYTAPVYGGVYSASWPSNEIPQQVKDAQCEAALRYLAGTDMQPDLARGGQIASISTDGTSITYQAGAPARTIFTAIEGLLRGLIRSGATVEIVRS